MPQLPPSQRYKIEALNSLKYGVSEISEKTGIPKCTASRELSRNSKKGRYDASRVGKMSQAQFSFQTEDRFDSLGTTPRVGLEAFSQLPERYC